MVFTSLKYFETREDLKRYNSEAWALLAIELKFNIDDIHSIAASTVTDGKNDRKCDLIYINTEEKTAIVGQSYFAESVKRCAKKNKASDLNTAVSWVLSRNIEDLPLLIQAQVKDLRNAIEEGTINKLEFWYVHNCHEHQEIKDELKTVEITAKQAITSKNLDFVKISSKEIGIETIEEWYKASSAPILVHDTISVKTLGGYLHETENWKVFSTAVSAQWIHEMYRTYNEQLFSANVRSYLGSRKTESNINNGIKTTASSDPENFLVFNNGITALVSKLEPSKRIRSRKENTIYQNVEITGISIVNGAQTTGAIGSLARSPRESAIVPVRFIECKSPKIIEDIIRFNNSQNTVQVADFRSTDIVQSRLRKEFKTYYSDVTYLGGRRGNGEDTIKRSRNLLVSDQVAQSLTAFHGDPKNATHFKSKIWENDDLYSNVFNEQTSPFHIVFTYSLYKAILDLKLGLKEVSKTEKGLKTTEQKILEFLSHSGSIYVLIASVAKSIESILNRKVTNMNDLSFNTNIDFQGAVSLWQELFPKFIHFVPSSLSSIIETRVKKEEIFEECFERFCSMIESTRDTNNEAYDEFAKNVIEKKHTHIYT
ncbi:AIPR protein [Paenibacillus sp. ov031]|uniref:AIPR family protein n=1 Tax=Paenibacillus sp. ov031 TaxID=1761879 RepID=UPI000918BEC8|nr:AIPR family protein [Paenibacillus sp. ov031]SHN73312.1 AIPR protein [Paenibacillus sp. ov031]